MIYIKNLGGVLLYKFPFAFSFSLPSSRETHTNQWDSKMVCLLILLVLNFSFWDISEARHQKKLHSAVVVGTVFCDTCFQEKFSETSHFISGATVAVECENGGLKPSFREEVKTDKRGEFKVHLPVSVSKHVKKIEGCSVQLIRSSEPYCAVAAAATSSSLQLKSRKQGIHTFSAGFFTFKPLKQPSLCNQKPSTRHYNTQLLDDVKQVLPPFNYPGLPSPIQNPTVPNVPRIFDNLPPLPFLPGLPPLPQLPPLPPLPGFPTYQPDATPKAGGKPDQFQPTITLLPHKKPWKPRFFLHPHRLDRPLLFPNPFQPSPSSLIPPPPAAAGVSPPSSPSPTLPLPFPLPPVPEIDPSTSKQTSP